MNTIDAYEPGQRVHHPARPEWGEGVIRKVSVMTWQGQRAQRLEIDFKHRGRVTINTAVARLARQQSGMESERKSENIMTRTTSTHEKTGWLDELERATRNQSHELWELPDAMNDPFASHLRRLEATLDSYRYSNTPRGLIDWAVMQTGLEDPLSKYTRQELEQAFPRFVRDRDQHLKRLVRQLKQESEHQLLNTMLQSTREPAARAALAKALKH